MSGNAFGAAKIRVGFQRNTPPFSYSPTADFRPVGYSVDLAHLVLARVFGGAHLIPPVEAVEVTSSTRERLLAGHHIDMECGSTTITPSRLRRNAFSRPIFQTSHRIAVKAGADSHPGGLHVVGIQGSTSQAALEGHAGFAYTFVGVSSIGEARDAFFNDQRVDAMVADEVILQALLRGNMANEGISLMDIRIGGECYGFMMRPEGKALIRAVDSALEDVFESDEYRALLTSWFFDELPGLGFGLEMRLGTGVIDEYR